MADRRPRSSRHARRIVLAATTGALTMVLLDATMVGVILPRVQRDLDLSTTGLQWVANAYLLALAALLPVGGRLADMLDDRRVLAVGVTVFAAASAAAGAAESGAMLIAARALQGAGAALMTPASLALVMAAFPARERARAIGLRTSVSTAALPLGPLLAGLLTELATWRLVFLINVPIALLTVLALRWAPDGQAAALARADRPRFDLRGALTLVAGLSAIVLALMQSAVWGVGSPATLGLLAVGIALLAAFVAVSVRTAEPLLDVRLLRRRALMGDAVLAALIQFGLVGVSVFGAILLQDLIGLTPLGAGLAILPTAFGIAVLSPFAARLYDRVGLRPLAAGGAALAAAGLIWIAATLGELSYALLIPGYLAIGVGVGLTTGPTNVFALNEVSAAARGQAAGLLQTLRQVGGTVGLAVIGAVVAAVQIDRLDASLGGLGVAREQVAGVERLLAEDAASRAAIAGQVPATEVGTVVDLARDAMVDAFTLGYAVAGGAAVAALAVAFWTLPGGRPSAARVDDDVARASRAPR